MRRRLPVLFPLRVTGAVDNYAARDSDFRRSFKVIRAERFKMPRQRKTDLKTLEQNLVNARRALNRAKAEEKDEERRIDTRRKIIAGALALEHFEKNAGSEWGKIFFRLLDEYVLPKDRELFEFLPKREPPPASQDNRPSPIDPDKLDAAE
jgi:hypothetical protein